MDTSNMLNVEGFAAKLSLKPSTIRAWIRRRKVTYIKLGRSIWFTHAEVDRIIQACTHTHKS